MCLFYLGEGGVHGDAPIIGKLMGGGVQTKTNLMGGGG